MEFSSLNCSDWLLGRNSNNSLSPDDVSRLVNRRNVPGIAFVSCMIVIGTIGNILVIIVFKTKYRKSTYRVFVLCLAFLDTINCCLTMPFVLTYILYSQNFPSQALCKIGHFTGFYIGLASPFTLILIAVDRYRNICQPLCAQISHRKANIYCITVNVVSLVLSWHVPVIYGNARYKMADVGLIVTRCYKEDFDIAIKITWWQYIILTAILILVTTVLAVVYFIIMRKVHQKSRYFAKVTTTVSDAPTCDRRGRRKTLSTSSSTTSACSVNGDNVSFVTKTVQTRKTTLTFLIITSVYIFSSFVHHALAITLHVVPDLDCMMSFTEGALFWTFFWTIFLNNIANPFIYGLSDERFRRHLKNFFHKKKTVPSAWTIKAESTLVGRMNNFSKA